MKKNGIEFVVEQHKKTNAPCYCKICGKEILNNEIELIHRIKDKKNIHLCAECALSNKNMPDEPGLDVYINGRKYHLVSKGNIKGRHACELTGKIIKTTDQYWYSSKDDDNNPNKNNRKNSYILSLQYIENPNEFEDGEYDKIMDILNNDSQILSNKQDENDWTDLWNNNVIENKQDQEIKTFFKQIYNFKELQDKNVFTYQLQDDISIPLVDYVKEVITNENIKKYFVFYNLDKIYLITRDKLFKSINFIGNENALKPISEIKLKFDDNYCDKYQKIEDKWFRID